MGEHAEPIPAATSGAVRTSEAAAGHSSGVRNDLRGMGYDEGQRALSPTVQTGAPAAGASAAPTPLATVSDFIALVERFERAYPACASDWQLCVTMLRKLTIYNGGNWDSMIADREDTARPTSPPMNAGDYAALDGQTGVLLSSPGGSLDVTHVLTGADSMNFPNVSWTMDAASVAMSGRALHGPSAATWSGDVGSALAHHGVQTGGALGRQAYYNRYASLDDMLGDVDGLSVGRVGGLPPNARFSQRLRQYYLGSSPSSGGETVQRRYTAFATAMGFNIVGSGSGKHLDPADRRRIRNEINAFAWLYCVKLDKTYAAWARPYSNTDLDWFTDHFIEWVNNGLAAEP